MDKLLKKVRNSCFLYRIGMQSQSEIKSGDLPYLQDERMLIMWMLKDKSVKKEEIVKLNKTAEEYRKEAEIHQEAARSMMKTFLATGIFLVATIVALVIMGMAWFVANAKVESASASIAASDDYKFYLATLKSYSQGVYDVNIPEGTGGDVTTSPLARALNKFFRADNNGRDDDEGNHYTTFLDLPNLSEGAQTFKDQDGIEYVIGNSDGISLWINSESNVNNTEEFEHIGPGSYGKFTFYIIPLVDNLDQVNLSVSLQPFTLVREGEASGKNVTGKAMRIKNEKDNEVLLNMLQGHILLFTGQDESGDYSNRIFPTLENDGSIRFEFIKDETTTTWTKDKAEPITIYWIWPKRFENIKYPGQEDSVFKKECPEHENLLEWVHTYRQYIVNTNTVKDPTSLADPMKDMTNKEFAQWSVGYNKGDQLIGDNIAFFQWVIEAE